MGWGIDWCGDAFPNKTGGGSHTFSCRSMPSTSTGARFCQIYRGICGKGYTRQRSNHFSSIWRHGCFLGQRLWIDHYVCIGTATTRQGGTGHLPIRLQFEQTVFSSRRWHNTRWRWSVFLDEQATGIIHWQKWLIATIHSNGFWNGKFCQIWWGADIITNCTIHGDFHRDETNHWIFTEYIDSFFFIGENIWKWYLCIVPASVALLQQLCPLKFSPLLPCPLTFNKPWMLTFNAFGPLLIVFFAILLRFTGAQSMLLSVFVYVFMVVYV